MSAADVTAVVVTWNSAAVIGECLASIRSSTPAGLTVDVVVVDNGSSDDTLAVVEATAPGTRVMANRHNRGLPAANNQALAASDSPFVLICNPDVRLRPGSVAALLDVLNRRPRAGWVVPRLLYEDGRVQTSVGDLPSLTDAVLGRQVARRRARRGRRATFWQDGAHPEEETRIARGHEAAYLVRRSAVDAVGGQDERYVLDWEGFDWADRFTRAGWEIWFTPAAEIVHLGGTSIRQVPFRWIASQHRGMYRYFADRRPLPWRPFLAALFAARAGLKMALVGAKVPMYEWAHRGRRHRTEH